MCDLGINDERVQVCHVAFEIDRIVYYRVNCSISIVNGTFLTLLTLSRPRGFPLTSKIV